MRLAILALCVAATQVQAQAQASVGNPLQEGSWMVGGTARLARFTESKTTVFSVAPMALTFVQERLAVGGEVGFTWSKTANTPSSNSWFLGPAVRYFFFAPPEQNLPYVGGAFLVGGSSAASQLGFEAVGGVLRMLSRGVGLNGELYLSRVKNNPDGAAPSTNTTELGVRFGVQAFIY